MRRMLHCGVRRIFHMRLHTNDMPVRADSTISMEQVLTVRLNLSSGECILGRRLSLMRYRYIRKGDARIHPPRQPCNDITYILRTKYKLFDSFPFSYNQVHIHMPLFDSRSRYTTLGNGYNVIADDLRSQTCLLPDQKTS